MLRLPLTRSYSYFQFRAVIRPAVAWQAARPSSGLRFNSWKTQLTEEQKIARRAAIDARDDLQKDWKMPIVSYEVMKQKSSQPRGVCVFQMVSVVGTRSSYIPGRIYHRCAGIGRSFTRLHSLCR